MLKKSNNRGNSNVLSMKIQRISGFQSQITFPNLNNNFSEYLSSFNNSSLGHIHMSISWQKLVSCFGLIDHHRGPQSIFSPKGKIALMFLKHYACCSDRKLIEQLNGNIHYQIFCDVIIDPLRPLTNYKIVSEIRCELAQKLNVEDVQKCLVSKWKDYMSNTDSMCTDATCYETSMRYPTDIKLLWECVEWNYGQLKSFSKRLGIRMLRTKKKKWTRRYKSYSKSRNPKKVEKRRLKRALLLLLTKIDKSLTDIEQQFSHELSVQYWNRRDASKQVLKQQSLYFNQGIKPKDRIVSIDKPYIRPIVRGKETKSVEFGAKVNKYQVDGISFIEHLSFDAFNEGTRLKSTIWSSQKLLKRRLKIVGADAIYATNANRKYITKNQIKTDFKRKGRPSKHKDHFDQLAHVIKTQRATRLEGSFGTDKEHFLLKKIMARTRQTEILWIFFGIHTSNALKIGRRMTQPNALAA